MNKKQVERMEKINKLIFKIGSIDRKFFNSRNGMSEFVEGKTTVKYKNGYTQKIITITEEGAIKGFNNGGTLRALVREFKRYIMTGKLIDGEEGRGGLYCTYWGYSIDGMDEIVKFAKEIGYISKENPSYKEYLLDCYKKESWWMDSRLKEEIEKNLLNI
ncbi:hypothetical protein [Clostridium intestinale]|uniref:Uncharacterized protein n=1 Tax=Clostridium intestinale TaxID=36845 RepID=A0A7D6VWY2_9CLOT|nr:hypothetical protein [Clostridium intestinale]QLY81910.1 hypothetical protein HZF06_10090 [Clostridium intestinale]